MQKTLIYDVFVSDSAAGNPCGVVLLDDWLSDAELQRITCDIAQPVTSFVKQADGQYHIRWFSLDSEINLCGHGSLGAGAALIEEYQLEAVTFHSPYATVTIAKQADLYAITLPSWQANIEDISDSIHDLAQNAVEVFTTRDIILVLDSEAAVAAFTPDFDQLAAIEHHHAVIITAPSENDPCGYVVRYFAPKIGIPEDRATGSAHCSLAPYWFEKLGSNKLTARQLSDAGGYFEIEKQTDSTITVRAQAIARK